MREPALGATGTDPPAGVTTTPAKPGSPRQSLFDRERAALDDSCRLAELWDTALQANFRLAYDAGYRCGVITGRAEEAAAWQAVMTGYATIVDTWTRDDLARARAYSPDPCATNCKRCSRCIHAEYLAGEVLRSPECTEPDSSEPGHAVSRAECAGAGSGVGYPCP